MNAAALGAHVAATGGATGRAVLPDEMSNASGISWQTGFTVDANKRLYMPSINFNKRLQRNKRYFGHFHCLRCKNPWTSGNAFQRHYQKCNNCQRTYPNKLKPLDPSFFDGELDEEEELDVIADKKGPHDQSACQRCKKLGKPCMSEPKGRDTGVNDLEAVDEHHDEDPSRF
mmetsp:Transcript_25871/g.50548  ORF Transcript_25871/g.50548 Transcript_25871/m.50548 type:complete len:172 (+) Transcript_25871:123-638(+)